MKDRVTAYAEQVCSGQAVAGKFHRLACERHLNDLKRQKTDDFPYYWNPESAQEILDYAETLTETAYDTSDFIPREECLTVYWQDYAIGPHSTGMLLFDLPWSDLGDILAEGWK